MRKELTIGDEKVEVVANAATPIIAKKIFREDILRALQNDPEDTMRYFQLAYVMAQQAVKPASELMSGELTSEGYIEWLEKYEYFDVLDFATDAIQVYQQTRKATSVPKPKAD